MKIEIHRLFMLAALIVAAPCALADDNLSAQDSLAAYKKVTEERAARIVATLDIPDTDCAVRVRDIIAQQYQDLSRIHDARDARIEEARKQAGDDQAIADASIQAILVETKAELYDLHVAYLARLSVEVSPEQVGGVKDGMTYGVAPLTYGVYLQMFPDMTDSQKRQVLAWLHEAREIAMDAGSSKEKHGVFGKYKGRINNYLVKEGYDLKKGEANLKKPSSSVPGTNSK